MCFVCLPPQLSFAWEPCQRGWSITLSVHNVCADMLYTIIHSNVNNWTVYCMFLLHSGAFNCSWGRWPEERNLPGCPDAQCSVALTRRQPFEEEVAWMWGVQSDFQPYIAHSAWVYFFVQEEVYQWFLAVQTIRCSLLRSGGARTGIENRWSRCCRMKCSPCRLHHSWPVYSISKLQGGQQGSNDVLQVGQHPF